MEGGGHEDGVESGGGQRLDVRRVADTAPDDDLGRGEARAETPGQARVGPATPAHAAEIEGDEGADAGVPGDAGEVNRLQLGDGGHAPEQRAILEVEAERAVGGARPGGGPHRVDDGGQRRGVAKRLRPHDHAGGARVHRPPGAAGVGDPGVEPDGEVEPGEGADRRRVVPDAGDGVEIGDVTGVAAEPGAEGAGELHGIRGVAQHAPDRRVPVALTPHGVHGEATLQVEDGDETDRGHERGAPGAPRAR